MKYKLVNECRYSLSDLFEKVGWDNMEKGLTQVQLNDLVKQACSKIHWYWEDRVGTDGIVYTAFSPEMISSARFTS